MAVKARAEITIYHVIDIDKAIRYYLLQSSTSAVPSKPTTNPPGGNWQTTEPSYTAGSTNTLYFVDLTVMSDETFEYSDVSKSSSYEAAKEAYNAAIAARKVATDYITQDKDGMTVGNKQYNRNVRITPIEVAIRNGDTDLARFAETLIELGLSTDFVLQIVNNAIRFVGSDGSAAIAHIGYGECNARNPEYDLDGDVTGIPEYIILSRPYYTLGSRSSDSTQTSDIGEWSIGAGENVLASGVDSVAFGCKTKATGPCAYAEGLASEATGDSAHAEGNYCKATGMCAHAEGSMTEANGSYSHAEGIETHAHGGASHAGGEGTIAKGYAQTVIGMYNAVNDTHLLIIGNGLGDESRQNALEVWADGSLNSAGSVRATENFVANSNNKGVFLRYTDKTVVNSLLMNASNELCLGYGQYVNGKPTKLYGNDISLFVKSADASFRPYYRKGDSISGRWMGAGMITGGGKSIYFPISLDRPIVGNPTVTVTNVNGTIVIQDNAYLYGTSSSTGAIPASIVARKDIGNGTCINVIMTMKNTNGVVYQRGTVGINASIKITFS